jgi:NYN domain
MSHTKKVPGAGVKKAKQPHPTSVHLFIDDSNIFIEGQRTARDRDPEDATARARFRIDYGRLLEWITENRKLASVYLVGSEPPKVDTFWKVLPKKGIDAPKVFPRQGGREKGVDHDLVAEMVETSILSEKKDAVIALVAGDGDYRSTLDRLTRKGWQLEVYFWSSGCSPLIRNTPWYVNLDPHFREFCFFEKLR